MLQIKDVPDDVHRTLKARAALAGVSLTEYARRTLEQAARRPSRVLQPPSASRSGASNDAADALE